MKKYRGFTMVELVITLAIAAIIVGLAVPSFSQMIKNNRRDVRINQILNTLTLARSEAIKRGDNVTVCKSSDGLSCNCDGADSNWQVGWITFVNPANQSNTPGDVTCSSPVAIPSPVPDGDVVRKHEALSSDSSLIGGNFANFITYRPDGFSNNNGNFVLCDSRGLTEARKIVVSKTGRGRIDSAAVTSCP